MLNHRWLFPGLVAVLALVCGCGSDDGGPENVNTGGDDLSCPVVVKDADCDKTQRPFVFVHGTYGSGDNFAHVASLLASNGFCADRIVAIEYNSLGDQPGTDGQLDAAVDKVLKDTGFDQVDLAGHSQGTRHCISYLGEPTHAAKVAHYINFSGIGAVPNDVETLSISSERDLGNRANHASGSKVTTFTLKDEDHFAVAASTKSFIEVYRYLRGTEPEYTTVQCGEDRVTIEGISETFADNVPVIGTLEIREVGSVPRAADAPVETVTPDAAGHFGPLELKRNVPYEFKGFDAQGKVIGYQYFTPFKRSNHLVRLLSPASEADGSGVGGVIASQSTDHVVRGPNHVALVARWAGGGFRQDLGASMTIDGVEVLTSENAGTAALASSGLAGGVVGFFMNDANTNGQTDLGLYYSGPFIAFTDVFLDTATPKLFELSFSAGSEDESIVGSKVKISNWPSSDVQVLVMFQ